MNFAFYKFIEFKPQSTCRYVSLFLELQQRKNGLIEKTLHDECFWLFALKMATWCKRTGSLDNCIFALVRSLLKKKKPMGQLMKNKKITDCFRWNLCWLEKFPCHLVITMTRCSIYIHSVSYLVYIHSVSSLFSAGGQALT